MQESALMRSRKRAAVVHDARAYLVQKYNRRGRIARRGEQIAEFLLGFARLRGDDKERQASSRGAA